MHPPTAKNKKLRILILTSSTGGGHDSRAYSLKGWLETNEKADVRVEHLLEDSSWLPRFGVAVYNIIQRRAPALHNIYWYIAEGYSWLQGKRLVMGRRHFQNLLRDYRPHLIVSVHDCLNRGYFQAAREALGDVKCCTYCGEWSGGFGFSHNWVDRTADLYLSRTKEAQDFAISLGMAPERCEVFCNLLSPHAFEKAMDEDDRLTYRKERLGLSRDRFTVLLGTGQFGANNHQRLLAVLSEQFPDTQAIALCGRNESLPGELKRWKESHPDYPLHVEEGYSRRVHELIQVSDCIVSRGGSNTTAEALFYSCPIVFNKLGGVMPQERLTLNYFIGHGVAESISRPEDLAPVVRRWADSKEELQNVRQKLRMLRGQDHPSELVDRLVCLAAKSQIDSGPENQ